MGRNIFKALIAFFVVATCVTGCGFNDNGTKDELKFGRSKSVLSAVGDTTKAKVFMANGGDAFKVSNSGTSINGGTGIDTIILESGVTGVKTDANIERVELAGNLDSYKFGVVAGTGIQILNSSDIVVVTIPSLNQTTTIAFADGTAPLEQTGGSAFTLGGIAVSTTSATPFSLLLVTSDKSDVGATLTTKSKVFLANGGDIFNISNSGTTISGGSGSDSISISSGVVGIKTDANIDYIELATNRTDYKFTVVAGTGLQIKNTAGDVVVTIPTLNQITTIAFADGSAPLEQTGGSAFTLGGITVTPHVNSVTYRKTSGTVSPIYAWEEKYTISSSGVTFERSNFNAGMSSTVNIGSWSIGSFGINEAALFSVLSGPDVYSVVKTGELDPRQQTVGGGFEQYTIVYDNGETKAISLHSVDIYNNANLITTPVDSYISSIVLPASALNRYKD
jgi:hypothetical protein